MKQLLESELLFKFTNNGCNIKNTDYDDYLCLTEIQIGEKIPDVILVKNDLTDIIAIEFKIHKWKDALIQASNYQLWAHKVYVALPSQNVHRALAHKGIFEKTGIGIISVDDMSSILLEAEDSLFLTKTYISYSKDIIKNKLSNVKGSEPTT